MPLTELAYCVTVAFTMTERADQLHHDNAAAHSTVLVQALLAAWVLIIVMRLYLTQNYSLNNPKCCKQHQWPPIASPMASHRPIIVLCSGSTLHGEKVYLIELRGLFSYRVTAHFQEQIGGPNKLTNSFRSCYLLS